jgi:flavin-dependent dehydrogenase
MAAGSLSNSEFKVLIVGGGPAGAATGIICALAGVSSCILERQHFPRFRPGESLHPGVEPLFGQLGVHDAVAAAGFLRHEGITLEMRSTRRFEPFSAVTGETWLGFQAWRAELDRILLERARSAGCTIRQPCTVRDISAVSKDLWQVSTSEGTIRGSFVVDAGGGSHWMARRLSLPVTRLTPILIAHCAYRAVDSIRPPAPVFQENDIGWCWRAMVRPDLENWTAISLLAGCTPLLPAEFDPRTRKQTDVTWRFVSECSGPGYFLTGDAAVVIDPASAHGVLRALMSGIFAGTLIVQLLRGELQPEVGIECYREWMLRQFLRDSIELTRRYMRLAAAPSWASDVLRACELLARGLRNKSNPSR